MTSFLAAWAGPALLVFAVWWVATGAILWLDGLSRRTFPWSLGLVGLLSAVAVGVLVVSADWATPMGAVLAFLAAIVIWGWNEMAFLMGYLVGLDNRPSPPGARGLVRFWGAARAILVHEIALALSTLLVALVTWGGANQTGLWTLLVLWIMRLSAKLNIFFGASNIPVEVLPPHLDHLKSHFRHAPMNPFFPVSVTMATLAAVLVALSGINDGASDFAATQAAIIAMLLALAVLEHWMLMLPIRTEAWWGWALGNHARREQAGAVWAERPLERRPVPAGAPAVIDPRDAAS